MKETGELVDSIPKGYEIYENPNGQVFLRKIKPKEISYDEKAMVETGIKKYTNLKYYGTPHFLDNFRSEIRWKIG